MISQAIEEKMKTKQVEQLLDSTQSTSSSAQSQGFSTQKSGNLVLAANQEHLDVVFKKNEKLSGIQRLLHNTCRDGFIRSLMASCVADGESMEFCRKIINIIVK